jgi:hypothetical protein
MPSSEPSRAPSSASSSSSPSVAALDGADELVGLRVAWLASFFLTWAYALLVVRR